MLMYHDLSVNETSIWYSWVIRSYIHLYGLEISHRYHGNPQKNNISIDEAPFEAFNLMHMSELSIHGHIKLNGEYLSDTQIKYITQMS